MQLAGLEALHSLDVKGKKRQGKWLKTKKFRLTVSKNKRIHSGKKDTYVPIVF